MPRLTIWNIECEGDSSCYSIRARTKKAAIAEYDAKEDSEKRSFANVVEKQVYEYRDAFHLADYLSSEDRGYSIMVESREYKLATAPKPLPWVDRFE